MVKPKASSRATTGSLVLCRCGSTNHSSADRIMVNSYNCARIGQWFWYHLCFFEINRKRASGNSVMFMLLHWYCHRCFGCGKMITFTLEFSTFSLTFTHATGPSHFVNAMQLHRWLWVLTTVHKFWIHFGHPFLGHQMTWSSQISVNTSCALSNDP